MGQLLIFGRSLGYDAMLIDPGRFYKLELGWRRGRGGEEGPEEGNLGLLPLLAI